MNKFLMTLSKFSTSPVQWDKTKLFYILREVGASCLHAQRGSSREGAPRCAVLSAVESAPR
jgi:hypothetical protein